MDLLLDRNGSNVGTNCSIASEIVFYVLHNDLSSFSILRAVERGGINFGSLFPFKSFARRTTEQTRRMKMSLSVINSIFNLVCTFLSSFVLEKPQNENKPPFYTRKNEREGERSKNVSEI
jgi:hypothetical protein